jgi:hypothetical protein
MSSPKWKEEGKPEAVVLTTNYTVSSTLNQQPLRQVVITIGKKNVSRTPLVL